MPDKILVLGKTGQLGRALCTLLGERAIAVDQADMDLLDVRFTHALDALYARTPFTVLMNAAAYTQVDKAEGEGKQQAFRINHEAVGELAKWCDAKNVVLVHYSTDYVFDGSATQPYQEDDEPAPINVYGQSKWAGEQAVMEASKRYFIFRTSWVYDAHGKNFFNTMLRLFHEKDQLSVVDDQIGAPTYAPHLAKMSWQALKTAQAKENIPYGLYHMTGAGQTNWYGFAQAIFALARKMDSGIRCQAINPILTSGYPTPAKRPLNSRLNCAKLAHLGVALPHWEVGLNECFEEKYGYSGLSHQGTKNHPTQTVG